MKISRFPLHSILLGVYPILNLYAQNMVYVVLEDTFRAFGLSLAFVIPLLFAFRIIVKRWDRAGVLCSFVIILFFSFGHIASSLETWADQRNQSFDITALSWIWLCFFLLFSFIVLRVRLPERTTQYLNYAGVILLIFPMLTIFSTLGADKQISPFEEDALSQLRGEDIAEASLRTISPSELPDIYYIILDAYGRADTLKELYNYDNSPFIEALEARGFYVAPASRSNYLSTTYSLNTSLNLMYIHDFPPTIFRKARYNLWTNHVTDFLKELGYQTVVFDSGTGDTNKQDADVFISMGPTTSEDQSGLNPFEQLALRTTMGLMFFEGGSSSDGLGSDDAFVISSVDRELSVRRERIKHALDHLPDYATEESRYFLFSHIYLPHFPFLYGPGGEELKYHENVNLFWYEVEPEQYIEYYTYQIEYLNQAILRTIDTILAESEKPVVIVLQADHGDEKFLDWEAPTAQGVNVRSAILNAIYYSDHAYDSLYPTLTPVNTFRLILNHWFGTQYPTLPDKVFFHEHPLFTPPNAKPVFMDSCEQFKICPPALLE
jgi:hypothetical protein